MLQSVTECYRVLESVTECYRLLQSIKEYYRIFTHLLGPISGLVFIIMLIFTNRYNEHDEGVAFAERGDPSVHPSNHPSDATTAKETTLLPNQCKPMHFSSICKFRFCNEEEVCIAF